MELSDNDQSPGRRRRQGRELQGPRPTPLKLSKDSHKIKKPPVAPQPDRPQHQPAPPPSREPVIIYAVSPKVIHTNPSDFMAIVQRLTGPDPATTSSCPPPVDAASASTATSAFSGEANRFVAFEKTELPPEGRHTVDVAGYGLMEGLPTSDDHFNAIDDLQRLEHHHDGGGGSVADNMLPGSPSAAAELILSPNPMLSPNSVEFLSKFLDQ